MSKGAKRAKVATPRDRAQAKVAAAHQPGAGRFTDGITLEALRSEHDRFFEERDWAQYHTPRNLLLAMVGEVGEVAELFQWRPDSECAPGLPTFTQQQREAVEDELSDVLVYLLRLASQCHVDLPAAVRRKMAKNAAKYPAAIVRGSAAKYTEYRERARCRTAGTVVKE